ncbi:hypothetical protein Ocin01_12347 [Orchesella cincta]|uniref:Peptidase C45 hydrolase domain-containing protein n=1 Tax=Orchesella cincta TaxID=48709 RepID=A0A1D2MN45_ORCCI|nr:hypothetical protein Ocin01_12347 [Orchesella cincta]
MEPELNVVPVLYARGTNYQVGFSIGSAFGSLIHDFLRDLPFYNKAVLPFYQLPEGRRAYENVLQICKAQFPQYVKEIEGTADGAGIPFYKVGIILSIPKAKPADILLISVCLHIEQLFILHVEELMTASELNPPPLTDLGCTDIMINKADGVVMGHTEDAFPECFGRTYIVQAEILDKEGNVIEQFSSVAYPGLLPGYTMGFNKFGMVHSVNTVNPANRNPNGTPREFLARALVGVKSLDEALNVLRNPGYGIADGFNLNIHFANQAGPKVVYSIEVGPSQNEKKESELDILEVPYGDSYFHCNRYVRLPAENKQYFVAVSSDYRNETLKALPKAQNANEMRTLLSDKSNPEWPVFRGGRGEDKGKTVMTGIFELSKKTWSIYTGPAATTTPVAVIHLNMECH